LIEDSSKRKNKASRNYQQKRGFVTLDDQFLTSASIFDRHMATTDFVTEPNPTSSLISIVFKFKSN
jgi:hypothetical protein